MPKEVIYDECSLYDVHVGWSKDGGYLQVGIETQDGNSIAKHLYDTMPEPGTAQGGWGEGKDETHVNQGLAGFTGLWGSLDRAGVNRLIRTLRKARDEAFGRDE